MGELVISTHEFETAKNRLKDFSQKLPKDLDIDHVETDGGFLWLFDHNVTGRELNDRLSTIQDHLISLNDTNKDTIKEFRQVYNALEALDKDYIQAILVSIKATEKTSEKIKATQEDLSEVVSNQKKTLEVLKKFKQRLDTYKHLGDIDKIWADCQKWHEEIPALLGSLSDTVSTVEAHTEAISDVRQSLKDTNNTVMQISNSLSEEIKRIDALCIFMDGLEAITHLRDIDGMWDSLSNAHASLEKLFAELESAKAVAVKHQQDIDKALSFIEMVSQYEHLKDIDTIWSDVDKHGEKLNALAVQTQKTDEAVSQNKKAIVELNQGLSAIAHLNDVDNLWESNETHSEEIKALQEQGEDARKLIQQNKDLADQSLADEKSRIDTMMQSLNKKIQYAYWVAGGSMALALIELFVILLG